MCRCDDGTAGYPARRCGPNASAASCPTEVFINEGPVGQIGVLSAASYICFDGTISASIREQIDGHNRC
jgi:hypothetical protein